MTVAASGATMGGRSSLMLKLRDRDLFQNPSSLIVTLVGTVFLVVLVAVQFGLRLGSQIRIVGMLNHTQADPWVVPLGTKSFDQPSLLPGHAKHAIFSARGVTGMEELAVGFGAGREPSGGATVALLVGSEARSDRLLPGDIIAGSLTELTSPNAVAVNSTHFEELGILGMDVFAAISAVKRTRNDPRSCCDVRGRQGHGTNPGS